MKNLGHSLVEISLLHSSVLLPSGFIDGVTESSAGDIQHDMVWYPLSRWDLSRLQLASIELASV